MRTWPPTTCAPQSASWTAPRTRLRTWTMTEAKGPPRFTAAQREMLLQVGTLYPEQVNRLQLFLQSIASREQRQTPRSEVREKLKDLQRALARVQRLYFKL